MNEAKVVYNDTDEFSNRVPRDTDISSVFGKQSVGQAQSLGGVKWRDGYLRNIETASVVTSYETNYQTTQSLRKKLDRAMTTLVRIRAERDHIRQEYRQVMAERDNVHIEIERLQEQVNDLSVKLVSAREELNSTS